MNFESMVSLVACAGLLFASGHGAAFGGDGVLEHGVPEQSGLTVVAFGDSTTAARGRLRVYADWIERDFAERFAGLKVINAGVGGNTSEAGRQRFASDVLEHNPDVVVIQFGINDAAVDVWKSPPAVEPRVSLDRFVNNLEFFVDSLLADQRTVIVMTPNPIRWTPKLRQLYGKSPYEPGEPDGFNVILKTYAQAVRTVAGDKKVALVDVYGAFAAYGQMPGQSVDDLLLDGMHPNERGHRLVADLLGKQIKAADLEHTPR